jgi:hypothetical protein
MSAMADGQHTGGMIALIPRAEDAAALAVSGGLKPEEMHLTLAFLGDDVTGWNAGQIAAAAGAAGSAAAQLAAIQARVMGHAIFNPDGHEDRQPCAVYTVGDSNVLSPLRNALVSYADHEQHEPFMPHVTAGFGVPFSRLGFTGPVVFDKIRVAIAEQVLDFPLGEAEEIKRIMAEFTSETKGKMPPQFAANAKGKADDKGGTADAGINNIGDLAAAVKRYKAAKDDAKAALWPKIKAAAGKLNAAKMIEGLAPSATAKKAKEGKAAGAPDNGDEKTLFDAVALEFKVTSRDPRAVRLREMWARKPKLVSLWKPGTPGDFKRLVRALRTHTNIPEKMIKGFAANVHHLALGAWPGREGRKEAFDWLDMVETKGFIPDDGEVNGDGAALLAQYKAVRSELDEALADDEDPEPGATDDAEAPGEEDEGDTETDGGDGISPEEAYDDAMDDEIDWTLEGDGTLTDENATEEGAGGEGAAEGETGDGTEAGDAEAEAELEELEQLFLGAPATA